MLTEDLPSIFLSICPDNDALSNAFAKALNVSSDKIDIAELQETECESSSDILLARVDYKEGDFICEVFFIYENVLEEKVKIGDWWEMCKALSYELDCKVLTDGDYSDLTDVHEVVFEKEKAMKVVYSLEPEEMEGKGLVILKEI